MYRYRDIFGYYPGMSALADHTCHSGGRDTPLPRFENLYDCIPDMRDLRRVNGDALRRHVWKLTLNTSMFMLKLCADCSREMYASTAKEIAPDRYEVRVGMCRRCVALNTLMQELFFDNTW